MALNYKSSLVRYRRYLAAAEADPVWRASAFVVLSLVLILGMILFAIRPTLIIIAGLVSEIQEQRELSDKLAKKIEIVREASDVLAQQRENITLLDQALPKVPVWQEWIDDVERIALEDGVVIQIVTSGPVTVTGPIIPVPGALNAPAAANGVIAINFTITADGDFEQVKKFTSDIENLRRLTQVSEINVTKNKEGAIVTNIVGSISYMMKQTLP